MSCFIAPLIQAAATSACLKLTAGRSGSVWVSKLPALEKMLWGGSLVLIVDHLIHGELFAFDPWELICVGLPMCAVVTAVWAGMVLLAKSSHATAKHL